MRKTLISHEFEFTCISCAYNVIKRKGELVKFSRKKINSLNRLKYAEHKIFCICIDVYGIHEAFDFDKYFETLSKLKVKNLKKENILIEKYKDMKEIPAFDKKFYSMTADGLYKFEHGSN